MPVKQKADLSSQILSPMPGIVKSIAVKVGQQVNEGHEICSVEAMKMQNKLVASRSGKVKKIKSNTIFNIFPFHSLFLIKFSSFKQDQEHKRKSGRTGRGEQSAS